MRKLFNVLATLVLLVMVSNTTEAQSTSVITGIVIDASTRRPLPGAWVELVAEGLEADLTFETYAGPTGRFRFEASEGLYVLRATRVPYAEAVDTVRVESTDGSRPDTPARTELHPHSSGSGRATEVRAFLRLPSPARKGPPGAVSGTA